MKKSIVMDGTREGMRRELKTFLKPLISDNDNPLIIKSDYRCPVEDLSQDIQTQIKLQRDLADDLYENCVKTLPPQCTTFRFTDPKGNIISPASFAEQFGNPRVVYATAIVAANSATKISDDEASGAARSPKKSLLLFAEVGGIIVIPELGKVKLITVKAKPNQLLSAGAQQDLQLSLPPNEQLFDLKSTEAQQLLVQEQSLAFVENEPHLQLVPVHVSHEKGRKFSTSSLTCLPITFDPSECELVSVVNDTVLCQKLAGGRKIVEDEAEDLLPPHVQKLRNSVLSLGSNAGSTTNPGGSLDCHDSGACVDSRSANDVDERASRRRSSACKSPGKKRGRPKKSRTTRDSNENQLEEVTERLDVKDLEHEVVKPKQRRQKTKVEEGQRRTTKAGATKKKKVKHPLQDHGDAGDALCETESKCADIKPEQCTSVNPDVGPKERMEGDLIANLLVLADAASISLEIDKENGKAERKSRGSSSSRQKLSCHSNGSQKSRSRGSARQKLLITQTTEEFEKQVLADYTADPLLSHED